MNETIFPFDIQFILRRENQLWHYVISSDVGNFYGGHHLELSQLHYVFERCCLDEYLVEFFTIKAEIGLRIAHLSLNPWPVAHTPSQA